MMQDGKFFEGAVLGRCRVSWNGFMTYQRAMKSVRKAQPCDPSDPDQRTVNDLHALVCERLSVSDYSDVQFFTAVGSPLDFYHGVDGWFEFRGKVVTIDVTLNPEKIEAKADIIIFGEDDGISRETLNFSAKKIAEKFQRR